MMGLECFRGLSTEVATGDFRLVGHPDDDRVADFLGCGVGVALVRADAETCSDDARMEFVAIKVLGRTTTAAFYDIDSFTHYIPPRATIAVTTWST